MKCEWLNKQSQDNLIVIFSGWAFGYDVFQHLLAEKNDFDVLFVNDYRQIDLDLPDLDAYANKYLLAWSFGVSAFCHWNESQGLQQKSIRFDKKVAVNGTVFAVDRFLGIPQPIMQKTIDTLSEQSFQMFAKRCFRGLDLPQNLTIDVQARKAELEIILQRQLAQEIDGDSQSVDWDCAWIAMQDKIFPSKNQIRAWQQHNDSCDKALEINQFDAPHAPFQLWSNWQEIFDL